MFYIDFLDSYFLKYFTENQVQIWIEATCWHKMQKKYAKTWEAHVLFLCFCVLSFFCVCFSFVVLSFRFVFVCTMFCLIIAVFYFRCFDLLVVLL